MREPGIREVIQLNKRFRGRERSWAGTEAEGGYCTPLAVDSVCPRGVCAS